jgi:hypothetical protein
VLTLNSAATSAGLRNRFSCTLYAPCYIVHDKPPAAAVKPRGEPEPAGTGSHALGHDDRMIEDTIEHLDGEGGLQVRTR